jgi:hypothetical protein
MVATLVKRRVRERSRVRKTPDVDESDDIACSSCTFAPTVFTEAVACQGGYLRRAPVAPALHGQTNRYILLEHSDWVCKAVSGKSRGRTPLRYAVTLCRLSEIAADRLQQSRRASALADDPLALPECVEGDLLGTPSKRRRGSLSAVQDLEFDIIAKELAPVGYAVPPIGLMLQFLAIERKHTWPAVYALDSCVHVVLDFLRYELEGRTA